MFEIKLTVEATELVNALNNLANSMGGANAHISQTQTPVQSAVPPAACANIVPLQAYTSPPSIPVANPQQASFPSPGVPLSQPPKYTTEQIMAAGAALVDAGKAQELMNLLSSFGVQAVTALKQEQLGAFATALREMGAKI